MSPADEMHPNIKSTKDVAAVFSSEGFRPSDFMRARRPELFSDSINAPGVFLTREVFEYHLDSLTNRKQEAAFEHFCRRLVECEICPNLLPQTGPTGGGDSKTDSETYPVAESVAMRWYQAAVPLAASQERWAFAFSAKKQWRQKVNSDVESIATTKRGYAHVYFVTNQFVKDKERATLEDKLSAKHEFKVHILDRSWILKCVFEHDRIELAVETLCLDQTNSRPRKLTGPRDLTNTTRLEKLEHEIDDPDRYDGASYQLVEDCLRTALLARNLELPRVDIEVRFARAELIAQKVDHPHQRLRVAYNRAWTCFWWYEDLDQFQQYYLQVESLAVGTSSADDLQMLTNLWNLLHISCVKGKLDSKTCGVDNHTLLLTNALEELASDKTRRNQALQAKTEVTFIRIAQKAVRHEDIRDSLRELRTVIGEAKGMISYPFEPIPKLIEQLGEFLTDMPEYEALFEDVVSIAQGRASRQQTGQMLLVRGFQKLRASRIYESIVYFGRAQQLLAMRESRWDISEALFACGTAYEAAGLLWASYANVLASANQVLSDYWEHGTVAPEALACAQKLVWIELQLGRPARVMEWIEAADAIAASAKLEEEAKEKFREVRFNQDAVLGILLLRAQQEDLRYLQYLPDVLEGLHLEISRMAVLYALGHEELLRAEELVPESETADGVRAFFIKWRDQPAAEDLPDQLIGAAGKMTFASRVLGCNLKFQVEDDNQSIFLAERLLAAIEALLSTSLDKDACPSRADYLVRVERSNRIIGPPKLEIDGDRGFSVVRHSDDVAIDPNVEDDWFFFTVAQLVSQIITTADPEVYLERIMGEEFGLSRAINFTETSVPLLNILGRQAKLRLADWNIDGKPKAYIVRRIVPWHDGLSSTDHNETVTANPGTGDPPKDLLDRSSLKHSDRKVISIINAPLWEKAKWRGALYIVSQDNLEEPPGLGLMFEDGAIGRAIFEDLRQKLGTEDNDDRLRVSIITGIDEENPAAYSLVMGSNLPAGRTEKGPREFVSFSRIQKMLNTDPLNRRRFEEQISQTKRYGVFPARMPGEGKKAEVFGDLVIWKNKIRIAPAWQISENDPDSVAIGPDDKPIIPPDAEDPPILGLIDRRKRRSTERQSNRDGWKRKPVTD